LPLLTQRFELTLNSRHVRLKSLGISLRKSLFLLTALWEQEKLAWSDPWLQSIELEYHNIKLDEGLYHEVLRQGSMRQIVRGRNQARDFHPA